MIERSTLSATFTIERHYPARPARVFAAWASVEAKARWAYCDEAWKPRLHELDFRVGSRERAITGPAGGPRMRFTEQGVFLDGYDDIAGREEGTRIGLDNLERGLRRTEAA